MEAVIKIKTNRIYFEQFETLGDSADDAAIKSAWEAAIYDVIEAAGFLAETEIGVGYDPAVQKFVLVKSDYEVGRDFANEVESDLSQAIELCEKYGAGVAEQAVEAGYDAAAAKSVEIVKSHCSEDLQAMSSKHKLGSGIFLSLRDIELSAELNDNGWSKEFPNQSRLEFVKTRIDRIEALLQMLDVYPFQPNTQPRDRANTTGDPNS